MSSSSHAHRRDACANCGAAFAGPAPEPAPAFCPRCGQETTLHPPSVREFLHEFVGHYVALEGALWKTLGLLVLRPGRLTTEYFQGRRRRYVLPLRLYLSASFLFFLVAKLGTLAGGDGRHVVDGTPAARAPAAASAPAPVIPQDDKTIVVTLSGIHVASAPSAAVVSAAAEAASDAAHCGGAGQRPCSWLERRTERTRAHWVSDPAAAQAEFGAHWMGAAPYAVFLMLPVFAAVVGLAYRGRRMLFGEHVVFSLHMHAFWFLVALVAALLPGDLGGWLLLPVALYGAWALRAVYGGGWPGTIWRAVVIAIVYGLLLSLGTALLALVVALQ